MFASIKCWEKTRRKTPIMEIITKTRTHSNAKFFFAYLTFHFSSFGTEFMCHRQCMILPTHPPRCSHRFMDRRFFGTIENLNNSGHQTFEVWFSLWYIYRRQIAECRPNPEVFAMFSIANAHFFRCTGSALNSHSLFTILLISLRFMIKHDTQHSLCGLLKSNHSSHSVHIQFMLHKIYEYDISI